MSTKYMSVYNENLSDTDTDIEYVIEQGYSEKDMYSLVYTRLLKLISKMIRIIARQRKFILKN